MVFSGLTDEQKEKYDRDGYLVVEDFLSEDDVNDVRSAFFRLVDKDTRHNKCIFSTDSVSAQHRDKYYGDSSDQIHYFYEPGAFDSNGQLLVPKDVSINRLAHGLHVHDPVFKKYAFNDRVKSCVRDLGMVKPVVTQSMYICKNAGVGGAAAAHQDATYLYMEPLKLVGMWYALEDVTLDNGCLWFVPGSHRGQLANRYVRNQDPNGTPAYVFKKVSDVCYDDSDFVPATVKKGSCVFIHGMVMHKSDKNTSNKSRHAYTFHIIDTDGTRWAHDNWLQPSPPDYQFPSLYNSV